MCCWNRACNPDAASADDTASIGEVGIHWLDAGLDGDAGIDGDDVPICGMCTGEGRIHVAIVGDGNGGIHACSWVPWDDGRTDGVAGIAAGGGIDACD